MNGILQNLSGGGYGLRDFISQFVLFSFPYWQLNVVVVVLGVADVVYVARNIEFYTIYQKSPELLIILEIIVELK